MAAKLHDLQARLEAARGRLALSRHEMARLEELTRLPEEDLDSDMPALSHAAFLRRARAMLEGSGRPMALACFQLAGSAFPDGQTPGGAPMRLVHQIILRHTRAGDLIGRVGSRALAALLDGCDAAGARAAMTRLQGLIRAALREEAPAGLPPILPRLAARALKAGEDVERALERLLDAAPDAPRRARHEKAVTWPPQFDNSRQLCQTVSVNSAFTSATKEVRMSLEAHIQELEAKRRELKQTIADLMAHPSVDDIEIARLKREKLHIKDEIARLKKELEES